MKKKNVIFISILMIVFGLGVGAATMFKASDIEFTPKDASWEVDNLGDAIDDLYDIAKTGFTNKKVCKLISEEYGTKGNIGSEYECKVSDTETHNFYILTENNGLVTMIMDRNITEGTGTTTMTWNNAMKYIENNNLKTKWSNVLDVNLPAVQDIANAVGNKNWYASDSNYWCCLESKKADTSVGPYCYSTTLESLWLWDYTRACLDGKCEHSLGTTEAYGYWTRDLIINTKFAWGVERYGRLTDREVTNATYHGIRPTITLLKSNLYE